MTGETYVCYICYSQNHACPHQTLKMFFCYLNYFRILYDQYLQKLTKSSGYFRFQPNTSLHNRKHMMSFYYHNQQKFVAQQILFVPIVSF